MRAYARVRYCTRGIRKGRRCSQIVRTIRGVAPPRRDADDQRTIRHPQETTLVVDSPFEERFRKMIGHRHVACHLRLPASMYIYISAPDDRVTGRQRWVCHSRTVDDTGARVSFALGFVLRKPNSAYFLTI